MRHVERDVAGDSGHSSGSVRCSGRVVVGTQTTAPALRGRRGVQRLSIGRQMQQEKGIRTLIIV